MAKSLWLGTASLFCAIQSLMVFKYPERTSIIFDLPPGVVTEYHQDIMIYDVS